MQIIRPRQRNEQPHVGHPNVSHITVRGCPIPGYKELRFGLPSRQKIQGLWSDRQPDGIYIATQGPLGWSALNAANALNLSVVSGFHTNFHAYSGFYNMGWLYRLICRYFGHFHNRTRFTLVPTQQVADEVAEMGIRNAHVCSRGIDKQLFNSGRRSEALRRVWGAAPDTPVFIYVGRLAQEKNVFLALTAFQRAKEQRSDAKMVLVGGGPLQEKIAQNHPDVILVGVKKGEELAAHYASADVFLFPSMTETFGNVVLEAVASGLVVVSYELAAAKEHLLHNATALLANANDADRFCQHAISLATRPSELQRLRAQAAEVCKNLSWEAIADQFFSYLVSGSKKGGACEIHTRLSPV